MATEPKDFSEEEINQVWSKAIVQPNNDPNVFRTDYAGAWIRRDDYGKQTVYGWQIDHVRPVSMDGTHNMSNLLPLHWKNNLKKSDDFPRWTTIISSNGIQNIEEEKSWFVKPENYV